MSRNTIIVIVVLGLALLGVVLAIAFSRPSNVTVITPTSSPVVITPSGFPAGSPSGTLSPTSTPIQTFQISMRNLAFDPASTTIKVGTVVTWTNNDSAPHTVVSDPNGSMFRSQTLEPGNSYSFTFNQTGSFSYYCSIHPNMRGTVTVTP